MTVKNEYVRRENMKSGICKDVDNDAVPPVPAVTLNWTRILSRKQLFIQRAHGMGINSYGLSLVGYSLVSIQELGEWWLEFDG